MLTLREQRGQALASTHTIRQRGDLWVVPSQSGNGEYVVNVNKPSCTCPDFIRHGQKCKHIFAVEFTANQSTTEGREDVRRRTKRGYDLGEVASALQKSIRRSDARMAGYWAIELFESGFAAYAWRRLLTISAEDCWGVITHEIESLFRCWQEIHKHKKGGGRIFLAKATILLAMARKCRDADHLTNLVYDQKSGVTEEVIERELEEARKSPEPIPDYAYDVHTQKGKKRGKTKRDFFTEEYQALQPKQQGLFDEDVEQL